MDVRVGTVETQVSVTDEAAMLSPETIERIVRAVLARLDDRALTAEQRDADRMVDHGRRGRAR